MANISIGIDTTERPCNSDRHEVVLWIDGVRFSTPVLSVETGQRLITSVSRSLGISTAESDAPSIVERCELCQGTGEVVARCSRYGAPSRCTQCHGRGSL